MGVFKRYSVCQTYLYILDNFRLKQLFFIVLKSISLTVKTIIKINFRPYIDKGLFLLEPPPNKYFMQVCNWSEIEAPFELIQEVVEVL